MTVNQSTMSETFLESTSFAWMRFQHVMVRRRVVMNCVESTWRSAFCTVSSLSVRIWTARRHVVPYKIRSLAVAWTRNKPTFLSYLLCVICTRGTTIEYVFSLFDYKYYFVPCVPIGFSSYTTEINGSCVQIIAISSLFEACIWRLCWPLSGGTLYWKLATRLIESYTIAIN